MAEYTLSSNATRNKMRDKLHSTGNTADQLFHRQTLQHWRKAWPQSGPTLFNFQKDIHRVSNKNIPLTAVAEMSHIPAKNSFREASTLDTSEEYCNCNCNRAIQTVYNTSYSSVQRHCACMFSLSLGCLYRSH